MLQRLLMFSFFSYLLCSATVFANTLNVEAYKGKVIYVDFWASWCAPCRQSFPWMKELQLNKAKEGLVIIGVNVDQEKKLADEFIDELAPTFNIIFDPDGQLATDYKVSGMPSAFIIDRNGKLRFKHIGFHFDKRNQYEKEIQSLLDEK